jgi:6-phosphofructokinase 1
MPLQIYLTESEHTLESMADNVSGMLRERGRCIVVVSEGFDVGSLGEWRDGFGNIEYGASRTTVAQVVTNYLNDVGFPVRGYATGQLPGVLQRGTSAYASVVDIDEAYEVGQKAVEIAIGEGSGWMATILREPGPRYAARYDRVSLADVADRTRTLPASWLTEDGLDVTDDFVRYARPLIGDEWPPIRIEDGRQRFARLERIFVEPKLPAYIPVRHRPTA